MRVINVPLEDTISGGLPATELHIAAAVFVLQSVCVERISDGVLPSCRVPEASAVVALLDACVELVTDDVLAAIVVADLKKFLRPESLRDHRIVIDHSRLERTVTAMHRAAAAGNRAAFETLLRRGLNQLLPAA